MKNISVKIFIPVLLALVVVACDSGSNPIAPEDHVDADGLILEHDGVEVYREFEGEVFINDLTLIEGSTLELSVHFLDHEGNEVEHEEEEHEEGEEDELTFTNYDDAIISLELENHDDHGDEEHCDEIIEQAECISSEHCEWHSDESACEDSDAHGDEEYHELSFELTGLAVGSTSFNLSLMHEGHADYVSLPISVTINTTTMSCLSGKTLCLKQCCQDIIYVSK